MARNGSGTYSLPAGNPVVTGTTISSTWANNTLNDIATALTNSIAKDGQTTPTANLPMGGFKLTSIGSGSAATDSANLGQIQGQAFLYLSSVSGADTITASTSPVTTSYTAGQTYRFVAAGANTGAVTININSLGAKSITKFGSTALAAGDIASGAVVEIIYDGTRFQIVNLASVAATNTANNFSGGNQLITGSFLYGYGTGAGGAVTQTTSKSTAVTLNKPSGQITMNNAALASATTVTFSLNNSLVTSADTVILTLAGGVADGSAYDLWPYISTAGTVRVNVRNRTAGSLSEAVVINFAIIKGSTS